MPPRCSAAMAASSRPARNDRECAWTAVARPRGRGRSTPRTSATCAGSGAARRARRAPRRARGVALRRRGRGRRGPPESQHGRRIRDPCRYLHGAAAREAAAGPGDTGRRAERAHGEDLGGGAGRPSRPVHFRHRRPARGPVGAGASGIFKLADRAPTTIRDSAEPTTPEARPVSNVLRKHPLSIAVSMALLAAAAAPALADTTGVQGPAPQGAATASPDAKKAKTDTPDIGDLSDVTVIGVREAQIRAIEVKRLAPSIQDSISAESIGQLPDTTI